MDVVDYRWSINAIRSFGFSEIEARKMKYLNTGTECLLMGIMIEGNAFLFTLKFIFSINFLNVS